MVRILSAGSPSSGFMDYKTMDGDETVVRMVLEKSWGNVENRSESYKLLSAISGWNATTRSKKPQWVIGDSESDTVVLNAGFILPAADGSTVTVALTSDYAYIPTNQLLHVYEDLGASGIAQAIIRYKDGGGSDSRRIFLQNSTATAEANRTFTAGATVTILPNSSPFDGSIGTGIELAPKYLHNAMMRQRESVEIGTHTHSDDMYADVTLAKQAQEKLFALMKRKNKWLYMSGNMKIAETNFSDSGISGGFDNFYRPDGTALKDAFGNDLTGLTGVKKLTTATGLNSDTLDEWMIDFTEFGGDEKILFARPNVINKFIQMGKRESILNKDDVFTIPGNVNYMAKMQSVDTAYGKIWLCPDRGANGINKYITDGTLSMNSQDWGVMVDPKHTKILTNDVPNGKVNKGVQSMKLLPVDTTNNNNSIDRSEWDCTDTLMIKDPRVGGYIGFGAS